MTKFKVGDSVISTDRVRTRYFDRDQSQLPIGIIGTITNVKLDAIEGTIYTVRWRRTDSALTSNSYADDDLNFSWTLKIEELL